jgi:hypothetical protein
VGVVGVTDRPSGVDSQFRRDCDWIAAHRVTWREHVDAVTRILGRKYDDALEDLDDGEAFLDGPWTRAVQRVRFELIETGQGTGHSRDTNRDRGRNRRGSSDRQSSGDRSGVRADVAALSDELASVHDRLDELEDTIEERNDVESIAGDIAHAIADRLDDRERTPREPSASREQSASIDLVETEVEFLRLCVRITVTEIPSRGVPSTAIERKTVGPQCGEFISPKDVYSVVACRHYGEFRDHRLHRRPGTRGDLLRPSRQHERDY